MFQSIWFSQFLVKKSVLVELRDMLKCVVCWATFADVLLDDIRWCLVGRIRWYLVGRHSLMSCWTIFTDVLLGDVRWCLVGRPSLVSCWTTFTDVFLEAFAKLWKATNNFFMSVGQCVRKEHLGCHWMAFHEIWYFTNFFENLPRKFKFHYNMTRITGTLHEDRFIFMLTSRGILLWMLNFTNKIIQKIKTHISCSIKFLPQKSCCLWENVGKILYSRTSHRYQ